MPTTNEEFTYAVRSYVEFLHSEANIELEPPIDLHLIYDHFGIALHDQSLGGQRRGFTIDSAGAVMINSDDIITRARFTQGHELIEFLFAAILRRHPSDSIRKILRGSKKEQFCDRGSSWLILPPSILSHDVEQFGISLDSASMLADQYETSLLATLIGMLGVSDEGQQLIVWQNRLKPSQERLDARDQLTLGEVFENRPVKKMRVWWSAASPRVDEQYIPPHISVEDQSIVATAFASGVTVRGVEYLNLRNVKGEFYVEAMPVMIGEEQVVISLIRMQSDVVTHRTTRPQFL